MNTDVALPIVAAAACLILAGAGLVSHRLRWRRMAAMALIWIAVFAVGYAVVEWFLIAQDTASSLLYI